LALDTDYSLIETSGDYLASPDNRIYYWH